MTETEKPTVNPDPNNPEQLVLHFPRFDYLDTQVWSVDLGIPADDLPALRDAIDRHLAAAEEQ